MKQKSKERESMEKQEEEERESMKQKKIESMIRGKLLEIEIISTLEPIIKRMEQEDVTLFPGFLNLFILYHSMGNGKKEFVIEIDDKIKASAYKKQKFCQICKSKRNTKRCSTCKQVFYCSIECQKKDFEKHKKHFH